MAHFIRLIPQKGPAAITRPRITRFELTTRQAGWDAALDAELASIAATYDHVTLDGAPHISADTALEQSFYDSYAQYEAANSGE